MLNMQIIIDLSILYMVMTGKKNIQSSVRAKLLLAMKKWKG